MKFLGNVLATIIGLFIFHVVLFGILIVGAVFAVIQKQSQSKIILIVLNLEDIKYDYAEK
jgi:protease-4